MTSSFAVYLGLGFEHLLDLQGYDHILFLAVLCAAYSPKRWRELLVLVTAFTIGHSVSLAVATLGLVRVDTGLVEFLIPVTIVATGTTNLAALGHRSPAVGHRVVERPLRYALALVFGVVHGLGFSNFLRLVLGEERSLFLPLLSFNVGLELAQIVAAGLVLAAGAAVVGGLRVPERAWNVVVSLAAAGVAAILAVQRWPF